MAISLEQIKSVLTRNTKNYWFSRKTNDGYENIPIDEINDGDVIWFNSDATIEDLEDAKKSLSSLKMHMYTKTMDEKRKKEYTGKPMYSKSGAFSFLVLPDNQ
tara:strand:- start:167 stop:475 length:309 start_codon:yes stop_codon:yes gene_type:complete